MRINRQEMADWVGAKPILLDALESTSLLSSFSRLPDVDTDRVGGPPYHSLHCTNTLTITRST
jgi:hypothetical protein